MTGLRAQGGVKILMDAPRFAVKTDAGDIFVNIQGDGVRFSSPMMSDVVDRDRTLNNFQQGNARSFQALGHRNRIGTCLLK